MAVLASLAGQLKLFKSIHHFLDSGFLRFALLLAHQFTQHARILGSTRELCLYRLLPLSMIMLHFFIVVITTRRIIVLIAWSFLL